MAIMASTDLDASKPQNVEAEVGKDVKSEVNGHASPTADAPNGVATKQDEEKSTLSKALVNGNGTAEEHTGTNGTASKEDSISSKDDADSKDKESKQDTAEPTKTDSATQPTDDVTMTDTEASKETAVSAQPEEKADKPEGDDKPEKDVAAEFEAAEKSPDTQVEQSESSAATASAEKSSDETKDATSTDKAPDADTEMTDKPSSQEPAVPVVSDSKADVPSSSDAAALPTSEVDLHPESMSQLAIESTEVDKSPTEPSADVSMTDAPSGKVAREREEDFGGDEPAPKRARTEPREEDPAAKSSEILPEAPTIGEAPALSSLDKWSDSETNSKQFNNFQRREIRKFIAKIKKSKLGASFRDSVQRMWPGLWDSYVAKVEKPMDLAEIDRNLRDDRYPTVADFKKDLSLIYDNSYAFNGPAHEVTLSAFRAVKATWEEALLFPTEEPAKPKPLPKPKPVRESRVVATDTQNRRQSTGPATSPAAVAPEVKAVAPVVQEAPAPLRRGSTAEGDRPKRTVRAPKSKDIDYSTKPSRKKLKPELQFCDEVLSELMLPKNERLNMWFLDAVDAEGLGIPNYYNVIKKPMDMGKVSRMLSAGDIPSLKDFDKNMRLIFSNCYSFNGPPEQKNPVSLVAKDLEDLYTSLMKGKDSWLAKHAKAHAPAASASNASDDEEDDEDEDGDDTAVPGVDPSKEVRELEAKLREESMKLTDLFAADTPNPSMIQIQQGIVTMVQEALLKAKQSLADFRQKADKPGKKAAKPAKPKAASGSAGRKPGTTTQPKKAGPKKALGKKNLTAADKDQIANAINDLDYPHLDRAIDIIKRDTGQAENTDGELELDIDQLSNEALLKLWELLKKVLPGFGKDSSNAGNSSPEVSRGASTKQAAAKAAASSSKSKKNKPMSAQEQEARIAQLQSLRNLYKGDQAPAATDVTQAPTPTAESSDDSDSEEE
ncbi:Bromodomain-containing factor [Paramyrothecium foliicola]|nr:Bromodomain-containing factor [Paramyrothecium foliicola]